MVGYQKIQTMLSRDALIHLMLLTGLLTFLQKCINAGYHKNSLVTFTIVSTINVCHTPQHLLATDFSPVNFTSQFQGYA